MTQRWLLLSPPLPRRKRVAPAPESPGGVRVFKRDPATGELTPTGAVYEVESPLGILAQGPERWGA